MLMLYDVFVVVGIEIVNVMSVVVEIDVGVVYVDIDVDVYDKYDVIVIGVVCCCV